MDLDAPALVEMPALDAVADHLAQGESLHSALMAVDYRATEITAIPLRNIDSDEKLMGVLGRRYCNEIARADATQVGVAQQGTNLWVVISTPLPLPEETQADDIRERLLALINTARSKPRDCGDRHYAAAPPLALSDELSLAAIGHAKAMARTGSFDHIDDDGKTPSDRVRETHYRAHLVGENIAAGMGSAEEALEEWLESPGHCENLMESRFTHVGAGFAVNLTREPAVYWTLDLAQGREPTGNATQLAKHTAVPAGAEHMTVAHASPTTPVPGRSEQPEVQMPEPLYDLYLTTLPVYALEATSVVADLRGM